MRTRRTPAGPRRTHEAVGPSSQGKHQRTSTQRKSESNVKGGGASRDDVGEAFLSSLKRLAESSIAAEVRAYFPDMHACRELETHGSCAYSGQGNRVAWRDTPSPSQSGEEEGGKRGASPRRPRRGVAEQLLADILSQGSGAAAEGRRRSSTHPHAVGNAETDNRKGEKQRPFCVGVVDCTTRLLTTLPCVVLTGYYVMWAETIVTARVVPREKRGSSQSKVAELSAVLESLPGSRRNTLNGRSQQQTLKQEAPSPSRTSPVARETRPQEEGRAAGHDGHADVDSAGSPVELCFHSLHLVHRSALTSPRRASFALQSIFPAPLPPEKRATVEAETENGNGKAAEGRPSSSSPSSSPPCTSLAMREQEQGERFLMATSLECYPRHMIHFGLPAHVLWNERSTAAWCDPARLGGSNRGDGATRGGMNAHAATSNEKDVPGSKSPAVLVLGLGGNVLGRCLDCILSPEVHLDIVELEPAVLEACLLHHQIPPLSTCLSMDEERSCKRRGTRRPAATVRQGRGGKEGEGMGTVPRDRRVLSFPRSAPAQNGKDRGRLTFYVQDAAEFLDPATQLSPSAAASPTALYDVIMLDCYDPEREAMMFGGSLVDRCRSRLRRPHSSSSSGSDGEDGGGGCLLVNAHVLPRRETLVRDFLRHGFAAVQALRVAGCDQSIIACFVAASTRDRATEEKDEEECGGSSSSGSRCHRFTRANLQRMCEVLNGAEGASAAFQQSGRLVVAVRDACEGNTARFAFDSAWMGCCRPLSVGGAACSPHKRARHEGAPTPPPPPAAAGGGGGGNDGWTFSERCCCVWEHKS